MNWNDCCCGYDAFMIRFLWIAVMRMFRFLELASGQAVSVFPERGKKRRSGRGTGQGNVGDMTEDNHSHSVNVHAPPSYEPDLNSNCALLTAADTVTTSRLSNVSSNDGDVHDTSDYQWFADFGYKDQQNHGQQQQHHPLGPPPSMLSGSGTTTNGHRHQRQHHPRSIFAALNSPNVGDFTYEDLSRNIDVNLAEIDMEDFRSEDINSILALPAMYCGDFQRSQNRGEQAASLSGSLMAAAFDSSSTTSCMMHNSCTSGESTDMSVCKSEPLFSPLKDAAAGGFPPITFSVDSLDCDSYNEQELMLTCQANMNNYTIAFEGSFTKYSDDSDYHEAASSAETTDSESWSGQFKLRGSDSVDGSLVRSDFAYTTWSKLKRANSEAAPEPPTVMAAAGSQSPAACKSQSLPNLFRKSAAGLLSDIKISQLNVSTDSEQCVPVYDVQSSCQSRCSDTSSQQSVSLMRLFMQRTSSSHSIAHSLSSGTLQQMDAYGNDGETSTDERLRCVLAGRLDDSSADMEGSDQQTKTATATSKYHGKIPEAAAKNVPKGRRLKMSPSANVCCRLFGTDSVHEDATARAASPLASPIQEEDENEETISSGDRRSLMDGKRLMEASNYDSMDGSPGLLAEDEGNDGGGGCLKTGRSNKDRSMATQTKCLDKSLTHPDRIGSPCSRSRSSQESKAREHGSGGTNDISSSSSGYKSIRNSGAESSRRKVSSIISTTKSRGTQIPVHVMDEAIQTSFKGEWLQKVLANCARTRVRDRVVQAGSSGKTPEKGEENGGPAADDKKAVYVCYPNYSLPDLGFLRGADARKSVSKMILVPTKPLLSPCSQRSVAATMARHCGTKENLRRVDLSHIQDWDSLNVLLPQEVRDMLAEIRAKSSDGEVQEEQAGGAKKEDSATAQLPEVPLTLQSLASEARCPWRADDVRPETGHRRPPPLPKRSISLPQGDSAAAASRAAVVATGLRHIAAKPPLPKGILRRSGAGAERRLQPPQRHSMSDFMALQQQQERHLNRHCGSQLPLAEQCDCFAKQDVQLVDNCPLSAELARMLGMSRRACSCCGSGPTEDGHGHSPGRRWQCPSKQPEADDGAAAAECEEEAARQAQDAKNKKSVSFSSGLRPKSDGNKSDGVDKEWPSSTSEEGDYGAPQEFCVSPIKEGDVVDAQPSPTPEVNTNGSCWQRKRDLVAAVVDAVEILNVHFGKAKDLHCKFIIGSCLQTPLTGYKVVHHLCPALFAILSDGLHQEVYNLFGHVGNSVWMVVEAVAQSGNCTKQMSDLVVHVNNEQGLWEKHMKFNAFVFGLLNIRSLDTWFSLLGTCSGILQKHYMPNAFLYSINSSTKTLFDSLLLSIQMLSLLPFDLDLTLETNLGSRQETQSGCDFNHNCLLHRDVPCCHSWMATLSKSTPVATAMGTMCRNESPRSSPVARRYGGQHHQSPCGSPRVLDHRLRRGYSQDSAIATGSSENSNEESPWHFDVVRSPQRPRSCVESGSGKWCRTNYSVPLDKRLSCGNLPSDVDRKSGGNPQRDKRIGGNGQWDKVQEVLQEVFQLGGGNGQRDKVHEVLQETPMGDNMLEARDPLIMDLMDGDGEMKAQCKKKDEEFGDGARQYAEKGALDATIAEDRDSQNNIKDAKEEEKRAEEDEDGAKFKELQLRWEILSCAAGSDKKQHQHQHQQLQRAVSANAARSKIPRLVTPPLRSGSRMEDSALSVRTSASGISSPDGSNYKILIGEGPPEEQVLAAAAVAVTEAGSKARTRLNPDPNRNNAAAAGRPVSAVLKVPAGQPTLVVKTSADKSPAMRKKTSPRKASGSPAGTPQTKHRQSVSRGVGGPEKGDN